VNLVEIDTLDAQPTVAAVWLGVNDFEHNVPLLTYSQNLAALFHALRRDGQTRVYAGNLPDLRLLPAFRARDQLALGVTVDLWNSQIERVARDAGVTLVDLHAGWTELRDHPEYISSDGFHPTTAGYHRVADLFWQTIRHDME